METIKIKEYKTHDGEVKPIPESAEFILLNHDGTIAMFYRWKTDKYNDGTTGKRLQFLSHFDIWQYSTDNENKLLEKLLKIEP